MEDTLTLTLAPKTKQALQKCVEQEGIAPEILAERALAMYFFEQEFARLCEPLRQQAFKMGITCDEDVFELIS